MVTRVLVVDDASVFRHAVTEALRGVPGIEVVGTAANGRLALSRMAVLRPDIVTLDVEMPELNGIEVLQTMRSEGIESGAIMLSSVTARSAQLTVKALELGAFDFVRKPEGQSGDGSIGVLRSTLVPMIHAYMRQREIRTILRGSARPPVPPASPPARTQTDGGSARRAGKPIVLIGISTGGPPALTRLVPALPRDLAAPVFIVQHMPPLFTGPLAASLSGKSLLPVKEAADGEVARNGSVYLAPGGRHMKIVKGQKGEIVIRLTDDAPERNCRPSVDYLFRSAALQFPGQSIAAVLTGMGDDGTLGLRLLKREGCISIAQDEASCVVFGMPKEAIAAGVVDSVLPLDSIAAAIVRYVREARP
jgi:two-component system chemotaxis response regulator CheB